MIRRENRQSIEDAFLDVHRQLKNNVFDTEHHTHYHIENISRGGLRFESTDDYHVDERIEIIVHMSNGKTHSAVGRICYCDQNGEPCTHYGVSFLDNFLEMAKCI